MDRPKRPTADRGLPHNWETERATLGAVLLAPEVLAEVREILTVEDFHRPAHQHLFTLACGLADAGSPPDTMVMLDEIERRGDAERVGGISYVIALPQACASVDNVATYAARVREEGLRRRLLLAARQTEADIQEGFKPLLQLVAEAEAATLGLGTLPGQGEPPDIADVVADTLREIDAQMENPGSLRGLATGFPDLDRKLAGLQKTDLVILAARPAMGKAQPVDAKVLTPHGYVAMGSILVGDKVIGSNGRPTRVVGVYPQGLRPVFRVRTSDGAETECCDEHLWSTQTRHESRNGGQWSVKPMSEIRNSLRVERGARYNHRLPLVSAPIEFQPRNAAPIDPYVLGLLLGDGSLSGSVVLHNPEQDIQARFAALLDPADAMTEPKDGITCRVRRSKRSNEPSETKKHLMHYGLMGADSFTKFIPDDYLMGTPRDRLELLRGLLDSDGYVTGGGRSVEVCTSSPRLRDGIRFLAWSLGGLASCRERDTSFTVGGERRRGATAYRMVIAMPDDLCPVTSAKHLARWKGGGLARHRQIESVCEAGTKECVCIAVDAFDHLYVTDGCIVTHNTALVLNIATNVAKQGAGVGIFSLEMGRVQLVSRLMCAEGRVDAGAVRLGELSHQDRLSLEVAGRDVAALPIRIDDTSGLTLVQLRAKAKRMQTWFRRRGQDLGLLVIDYLQLMQGSGAKGQNRENVISEISRGLKVLAKELDVPIIALSQLNRSLESRTDKRPMPSDLRESGAIEQDADVILFIYRDEVYNKEATAKRGIAEVIVAKQRGGSIGTVELAFLDHYVLFQSLARQGGGYA